MASFERPVDWADVRAAEVMRFRNEVSVSDEEYSKLIASALRVTRAEGVCEGFETVSKHLQLIARTPIVTVRKEDNSDVAGTLEL